MALCAEGTDTMAMRGTELSGDDAIFNINLSSPGQDVALRWHAFASPADLMLAPQREARPFGLDDEEPNHEELA